MILYTKDELFNLLEAVDCHSDVIEINHYVLIHCDDYPTDLISLLLRDINLLHVLYSNEADT